ncbi:MAG: hypothetical protein SFU98_12400 [Leptospiraceae bacterium]|nr:hypothetical protein [Leptospiraceae bacterium]
MKHSVTLFLLVSFFSIQQSIFSQAKAPTPEQPKKESNPKDPATPKDKDAKTTPDKPLKNEEGAVIVDPLEIAKNLRLVNLRHLKKLKSAFINSGMEDKYNALVKSYVDATVTLNERNYKEARRKFEQNSTEIGESVKPIIENYRKVYAKLYTDYSFVVVDSKINSTDPNELGNSSYEKLLAMANEFQRNSLEQLEKGSPIEAVYTFKQALFNLIKIPYFLAKNKNKNLKLSERIAQGLLIDEDYIPKDLLKDYDDTQYQIFTEREKEREKERENFKKGLSSKFGKLNMDAEQPKAVDKDKKPTEVKPAPTPAPQPTEKK